MQNKKCNYMTKKRAFSYLELIISMALVTIIVVISGPFLATVSKKDTSPFGEYKCYARYVDGEWKLFENERINSPSFPVEDEEVKSGGCKFKMPNGNISQYTVTIYGGGGSGSSPYFDRADSDYVYLAQGQDGENGEEKTVVDSLAGAFDANGELNIDFCDYEKNDIKACVGKGGEVNERYDLSYAKYEKIKKIIISLDFNTLSDVDKSYLTRLNNEGINTAISNYNINNDEIALQTVLKTYITGLEEKGYNTGRSGDDTKILLSSGNFLIANGGKYGLSDVNSGNDALNIAEYKKENYFCSSKNQKVLTYFSGSIQKYSEDMNGQDGNTMLNSDTYVNFGLSGKAGILVCKLGSDNSLLDIYSQSIDNNINEVKANKCYSSKGGRGAGGVIKIQWN